MLKNIILLLLYYSTSFIFGAISIYISPEIIGFFLLPISYFFFFLAIKLTVEIKNIIHNVIVDRKFQKIYNKKKEEFKTKKALPSKNSSAIKQYTKKKLISPCEMNYGYAIQKVLPPNYILRPQICLASIIQKTTHNLYINELFKIIDFGIFDKEHNAVLLIEINDKTHNISSRKIRDQKVRLICEEAGIPLISFWTVDGINEYQIREEVQKYLFIS